MKIYDTNKGADSQGRGHYFLRFVHQLSCHVFNFKLKALNARSGLQNFLEGNYIYFLFIKYNPTRQIATPSTLLQVIDS